MLKLFSLRHGIRVLSTCVSKNPYSFNVENLLAKPCHTRNLSFSPVLYDSTSFREPEFFQRDKSDFIKSTNEKLSYSVSETNNLHLLSDTIYDRLCATVEAKPDDICYKFMITNTSITFRELKERVDKLAIALLNLGFIKGDRIAVLLPNVLETNLFMLAANSIGVIVVLMNPAYQQLEIDYMLNKSTPKGVVIMDNLKTLQHYEILKQICPEIIVHEPSATFKELQSTTHPFLKHVIVVENSLTPFDSHNYKGTIALKDLEAWEDPVTLPLPYVDMDDPAFILFTSGTTGEPKGAVLTHHNLVNAGFLITYLSNLSTQNTRVCCPVPIFHCFGLIEGALSPFVSGGTTIFPSFFPDTLATLKAISQEKCNSIKGAPVIFNDIINHPERSKYDLSSLSYMVIGASPVHKDLLDKIKKYLKIENIIVGYGLTETSAGATACRSYYKDISDKYAYESIGKVFPHVECKIIDEEGKIVPHNQEGEICFRGYNVMKEYWNDPEKTAEVKDANGWLRTGDIAYMDENGVLFFKTRAKELIIRGGVNVYPAEVEAFFRHNEHIVDCYCFGIPDERTGEQVCLWAKLKPESVGKVTVDDLKHYCEGKIAYFKIPKYIKFVESFPINANGKVQKFKMTNEMKEELNEHK